MSKCDLVEQLFVPTQEGLEVDREAGIIRNVKVLGPISRNGNIYTERARKDASDLYEGIEVYDGHKTRKYSDHIGNLSNPRVRGDIVIADFLLKKKHALYEQILDDAEHRPGDLALSHEVLDGNYKATLVPDGLRVDRIYKVDAVAVVKKGGTNKSLVEEHVQVDPEIKTLDDLKQSHGDLLEQYRKDLVEELQSQQKDNEKLARVIAERDAIQKERDELKGRLDLIEEEKRINELKADILREAGELSLGESDISTDLMEEFLGGMKRERVTAFLKTMRPSTGKQKKQIESSHGLASGDDSDKPFYLRGSK